MNPQPVGNHYRDGLAYILHSGSSPSLIHISKYRDIPAVTCRNFPTQGHLMLLESKKII